MEQDHVVIQGLFVHHPTRQGADLDLAGGFDLHDLEDEVGFSDGLAGQAGPGFASLQGLGIAGGIADSPGHQGGQTGTAHPATTAIGQDQTLTQGRRQQGFTGLGLEVDATGLRLDIEGHGALGLVSSRDIASGLSLSQGRGIMPPRDGEWRKDAPRDGELQ